MLVNKQKPKGHPVLENGTMIGAIVSENVAHGQLASYRSQDATQALIIPEIVISASYSSHSLNQNHCDMMSPNCSSVSANCSSTSSSSSGSSRSRNSSCNNDTNMNADDAAAERIALLREHHTHHIGDEHEVVDDEGTPNQHDAEFEQFVLNRTTSESNMLETSIYSELQFPPSINGEGGNGGETTTNAATISHTPTAGAIVDMLNSSACSRSTDSSRQSKRMRRQKIHNKPTKVKCNNANATASAVAQTTAPVVGNSYPPQYTAIFLEGHHGSAANAMGQLASAAASSPFLSAPVQSDTAYLQHHHQPHIHHQQYQYYQQRPMLSTLTHHHQYRRNLLDATVPLPGTEAGAATSNVGRNFTANDAENGNVRTSAIAAAAAAALNAQVSSSDIRKWFSRPSLPFVIGVLALLGVACTLGGIVLGSTGLIEHSTQYLSAALLMIGIGVSLLVISGVIWRLSLPDDVDDCPCFRHLETCRSCNSPYCANRLMPGSYLYPEFQHRPPPPSYLTSLNECTTMGFLLHPSAGNVPPNGYNNIRLNTPPPLYRSTNSLNAFVPIPTNAVTANANLSSTIINQTLPEAQNALQPLTKEINYLDLD